MLLGYGRVSKSKQNLDRRIDQLKACGCDKIFLEKLQVLKKNVLRLIGFLIILDLVT